MALPRGSSRVHTPKAAFTLVEVLLTIALLAILVAILLPALGHTVRSARSFRCQMSLRSIAFDFQVFADPQLHGDRGHDEELGRTRFRAETFQESQYGIDEFWRWGDDLTHTVPDASGADPMRCAEVRGPLTLLKDTPCYSGAISPSQNVSYGFNLRLHIAEVWTGGKVKAQKVILGADIVAHQLLPLAWDVDGQAAYEKDANPVFSAPAMGSKFVFAGDRYWFPAMRHNRAANFAFADGHVVASARPLDEPGWLWSYQPVK